MVLSNTKRTSSISSVINRFQSGGSAKAGLTPQVGVTNWVGNSYKTGTFMNLGALQTNVPTTVPTNVPTTVSTTVSTTVPTNVPTTVPTSN